jgi:TRAP-type C4-dicarboxylate transport system permease small subunit
VDLIDSRLPPRARVSLEVLFDALMVLLLAVMVPGCWRLIEIGKDQELLGTMFTAAIPAAGVLIALVLMLFYVGLRLVARLLRFELPRPEDV